MASQFLARLRALFAVLFDRPLRVRLHGGAKAWLYPARNLVIPVMAGGAPEKEEKKEEEKANPDEDEAKRKEEEEEEKAEEEEEEKEKEKKGKTADEYRRELRRTDRRAARQGERHKAEKEALEEKLKKRDDADKSDQEKAVEKAKEEGRSEAESKAQEERKKDRLESAVIRAAGKKIEIGDGDDKKKVRFEDPEDAELYLQRKIAKGDLDEADLFDDDGKIKTNVLNEALQEILEEKPRLAEDSGGGSDDDGKPKGGADQGKGKGGGGNEDGSVESEFKAIRRNKD